MKNRRLILIVVVLLLTFISLACYPASFSYLIVDQVFDFNGMPYLHASQRISPGGDVIPGRDYYFTTYTMGKTWFEVEALPHDSPVAPTDPKLTNLAVCVPDQLQICYRIQGQERIEVSYDGGMNWQTDWQLPTGRAAFMNRNAVIYADIYVDTVPYDFHIFSDGSQYTVIVAMGNQGVLVRSPSGKWDRVAVSKQGKSNQYEDESFFLGYPLPIQADTFSEAEEYISLESFLAKLGAYLFVIMLSKAGLNQRVISVDGENKKKISKPKKLFRWSIAVFIAYWVVFFIVAFFLQFENPIIEFLSDTEEIHTRVILFVPLLGVLGAWVWMILAAPERTKTLWFALRLLGCVVFFLAGTWLPFLLWTFNLIPIYEVALGVAITAGLLAVLLAVRVFRIYSPSNHFSSLPK